MITEDELYKVRPGAPYTDREKTIPVSEIFGPTLEGEGPWAGEPTYFLRIGGCDYACDWCDTDQAVLAENVRQLPRLTQEQIWQRLHAYTVEHPGPDLLAISGGNPGLYDLGKVVTWWHTQERSGNGHGPSQKKVLVETQGSRYQDWFSNVDLLTVSPKPPSSGLDGVKSLNTLDLFMGHVANNPAHKGLYHQMIFKVVVFDEEDYQFARFIHVRYPDVPFHLSTGTAMGGLTGRWVAPAIPDLDPGSDMGIEFDKFRSQREHPDVDWTPGSYVDSTYTLLRRYRWLAERAMNDSAMADAKVQVQLHCLLWGITTKGV